MCVCGVCVYVCVCVCIVCTCVRVCVCVRVQVRNMEGVEIGNLIPRLLSLADKPGTKLGDWYLRWNEPNKVERVSNYEGNKRV